MRVRYRSSAGDESCHSDSDRVHGDSKCKSCVQLFQTDKVRRRRVLGRKTKTAFLECFRIFYATDEFGQVVKCLLCIR